MADDASIYRARADAEFASAAAAPLANVRDRCERSARAWAAMADRAERTAAERRARDAATLARTAPAQGSSSDASPYE